MGLFADSNLWLFIFSFLPGLIYSFIVYLNTPYRSVRLSHAFNYLFVGFLSSIFVLGFHLLFPNWKDFLFTELLMDRSHRLVEIPTLLTFFFYAFVQVALVEELSKLGAFRVADARSKEESPIATMFNYMMIGVGFAVVENILYAFNYGGEVLLVRNFTALVMHMTMGIMAGYFIALGKQNTKLEEKTNFQVFLKFNPKWKKVIYAATGILVATLIHGLYDFNLFILHDKQDTYAYITIIASLMLCYAMGKDLLRIHNQKK